MSHGQRYTRRTTIRPTSAKLALTVINRREREEGHYGSIIDNLPAGTYLQTSTGIWLMTSNQAFIRLSS